jgi:hypothetical protein
MTMTPLVTMMMYLNLLLKGKEGERKDKRLVQFVRVEGRERIHTNVYQPQNGRETRRQQQQQQQQQQQE